MVVLGILHQLDFFFTYVILITNIFTLHGSPVQIMGNVSMAFAKEELQEIESFLYENLPRILADQSLAKPPVVYEIELRERMVRVEEELKNQRELMKEQFLLTEKRFEQIDKRFEDMQKYMNLRFEDMNTKFKMMFSFMTLGFTILAAMMTLFKFFN